MNECMNKQRSVLIKNFIGLSCSNPMPIKSFVKGVTQNKSSFSAEDFTAAVLGQVSPYSADVSWFFHLSLRETDVLILISFTMTLIQSFTVNNLTSYQIAT